MEEMKLVRPMIRRALCRCSVTRGLLVGQGGCEKALKGVAGNGGVGGVFQFEGMLSEDRQL
jgi:hypothetical protein